MTLRTDWPDENETDKFHAADMNLTAVQVNTNTTSIANIISSLLPAKQSLTARGLANGYAPLGADAKVPAAYLPSGGGGGGSLDLFDYWENWADNANGAPVTADSLQTYTSSWAGAAGAALTVVSGKLVCTHNTGGGQVAGYITAPLGNPGLYGEGEFQFVGTGTDGATAAVILFESPMPSGNTGALSQRAPIHMIFTPTYSAVQIVDTASFLVANIDVEVHTTPSGVPQKFAFALDRDNNRLVVQYPNGTIKVLEDTAHSYFANVAGSYLCQEIVYVASNTDKRVEWLACRASAVIGADNIEYASKYDQLIAIGKVISAGGSVGSFVTYAPPPTGVEATDTAALQAAHDALPAAGGTIWLREGVYMLSATGVTFTKKVHLIGAGMSQNDSTGITVLGMNSTNGTAITCNAKGCILEDFGMSNVNFGVQTGGAAIRMQQGHESKISRVWIFNFYDNISYEAGEYWSLNDSISLSPYRYSVRIRNSDHNDAGDMNIFGCWFDVVGVSRNATAAVRWETGSGLRLNGCKFNGGATYKYDTHVDVAFDAGLTAVQNSADIFIQNCSVENAAVTGIKIARAAGAYALYEVMVQNNEFMNCPTGVSIGQSIHDGMIDGNVFLSGATSTGIALLDGAVDMTVGTNRFNGVTTPVSIAAGTTGVKVAPQHIAGDGIIVSDASAGGTGLQTATVDYRYSRAINWTVNATPVTVWTLGVANSQGGLFTVYVSGVENTVGGFMLRKTFKYTVDGSGVVTVAAVGSADTAGSTNPVVTTTAGTNTISVKLATAGNSILAGVADIDVKGYLSQFKVGA